MEINQSMEIGLQTKMIYGTSNHFFYAAIIITPPFSLAEHSAKRRIQHRIMLNNDIEPISEGYNTFMNICFTQFMLKI